MKIIRSKSFTATRPWGALDIANMGGITTRLHWTDQPYKWHVNDGEEVFAASNSRRFWKRAMCSTRRWAPNMSRIRSVWRAFWWLKLRAVFDVAARYRGDSVAGAHGSIMDERRGARAGRHGTCFGLIESD
jgi:hypothetical protein